MGYSVVCLFIYKREDSFYHDLVHKLKGSLCHAWDSFCRGIHLIIERIHFIIVLNPSNKIISLIIFIKFIMENFSFVYFILYNRKDLFYYD